MFNPSLFELSIVKWPLVHLSLYQIHASIYEDDTSFMTEQNYGTNIINKSPQICVTLWCLLKCAIPFTAHIWTIRSGRWFLTALCRSQCWSSPSSAPTCFSTYSVRRALPFLGLSHSWQQSVSDLNSRPWFRKTGLEILCWVEKMKIQLLLFVLILLQF